LFDAHRDDPEFGYRFLADEARDAGWSMADRTAWRICSARGWWSVFGKKRGRTGKKAGPPVHDDLVQRDFTAVGAGRGDPQGRLLPVHTRTSAPGSASLASTRNGGLREWWPPVH
jgi:hypothetical protein